MAFQFPTYGGYTGPYAGVQTGGGGGDAAAAAAGAFGMNPWALGIGAGTALLGAFGGSGAATKQKQILGYQRQIAEGQRNLFANAAPQYQAALERYANDIGLSNSLGLGGYSNQVGVSPHQAQRLGISPETTYQTGAGPTAENGYLMGPYDQQAYRLRSAAAEQALQHQMQNADQNLQFQLGRQGISTGTQAAALAREHQNALQNYADFRRQLAIQAGQQEQQNLQNFAALAGQGLGQGVPAESVLGQQAGVYGQQAQQGFGAAGSALNQLAQYATLQPYLQNAYAQGINPFYSQMGYGGYGMGVGQQTPMTLGTQGALGYGF